MRFGGGYSNVCRRPRRSMPSHGICSIEIVNGAISPRTRIYGCVSSDGINNSIDGVLEPRTQKGRREAGRRMAFAVRIARARSSSASVTGGRRSSAYAAVHARSPAAVSPRFVVVSPNGHEAVPERTAAENGDSVVAPAALGRGPLYQGASVWQACEAQSLAQVPYRGLSRYLF
jgi:hypothetical protein